MHSGSVDLPSALSCKQTPIRCQWPFGGYMYSGQDTGSSLKATPSGRNAACVGPIASSGCWPAYSALPFRSASAVLVRALPTPPLHAQTPLVGGGQPRLDPPGAHVAFRVLSGACRRPWQPRVASWESWRSCISPGRRCRMGGLCTMRTMHD